LTHHFHGGDPLGRIPTQPVLEVRVVVVQTDALDDEGDLPVTAMRHRHGEILPRR